MSSYSLLFATIHKTLMQPTSSISITFPADKTPAPFGNSRISVGVGNTIVSFAFFGVGPSIAAYAILKVLEENEETESLIPFMVYQVVHLNAVSLLAAGAVYSCYLYLRGNSFPAQLSTTFKK